MQSSLRYGLIIYTSRNGVIKAGAREGRGKKLRLYRIIRLSNDKIDPSFRKFSLQCYTQLWNVIHQTFFCSREKNREWKKLLKFSSLVRKFLLRRSTRSRKEHPALLPAQSSFVRRRDRDDDEGRCLLERTDVKSRLLPSSLKGKNVYIDRHQGGSKRANIRPSVETINRPLSSLWKFPSLLW